MIKAIIFDCFGVLTTEAFHAFRNEYFLNSPEKRSSANQLMDNLNAAKISYDVFLSSLAEISGISKEEVETYLSSSQPNKPLFKYIKDNLKGKYRIGMLSNAGGNWLEQMFGKEKAELFDDVVLSYEHGILKPEAEIYKLAAQRLGVKPEECIFIDDNLGHCKGAQKTGMKSICYQDFLQTQKELNKLLAAGPND
jgi:epoxide hydrolase-like predicted phosphatase